MAGTTEALEVLPLVRITQLQSPDQPRRHNVIHMAPYSSLAEVSPARFVLAFAAYS
ncbi:MAG: hypothetical protein L0387_33460 [Acidobacteria bacterium]|nr:hypothetical protein [Acidobacteriota bacterium]MCI0722649.1 hypothetical protein [Acidobacteriota bacterium]